jgi:uncharacterized protein (DUF58 family)
MQRRWIVVWLALLLILAGITTRSGALISLSLPIIIYLGAGLLMTPERADLSIQRFQNADFIHSGTAVQVKTVLANQGPFLPEIVIEEGLPVGIKQRSGTSQLRTILEPGEQIDLDYSIHCQRGNHKIHDIRVTISDPFSLFPQKFAIPAFSQLTVIPVAKTLHPIRVQPQQTRPYPGAIRSRKGGSGTDFFGIRTYQPGDPMRWVNWKAAAYHEEELFTNQFERENIADIGIIVDARQQVDVRGGDGEEPLFETCIGAAASLADTFLKDGNRVSLLVYGYGMDRVFPGYGKSQRERILRCLAEARTGHNYPLESLNYLPTRLFPTRSQLVMVSPLSRHDTPQLIRLQAAGYELLIISPDPVDFQSKVLANRMYIDEARRIAYVERDLLLRKLFRAGIQVVDWKIDQSLDHALQKASKLQMRAARPVRWQR